MSELTNKSTQPERVTSGIAGLDRIMQGGLLKGRTYLIMGIPGAGKTILSNQICFHHVASGGRALYFTLLAETSSRMLADIQTFDFFDPDPINNTISYVSAYPILEKDGLEGLINLIRSEIRRHRAQLVVIDGLVIARQAAEKDVDWKKFLHALQASAELLKCTTLLLTPTDNLHTSQDEQTMSEGIIELTTRLVDMRSVHEIQIHKFRGSAFLEGKHLYSINETGFVIHPRLEAIQALPTSELPQNLIHPVQAARLKSGISQLDEMMDGGILSGSTTLLLGAPGTGKTLLGSHFLLEGAAQDEKGLYYSFFETPAQLVRKLDRLNMNPGNYINDGKLELYWQSPIQDSLDILAEHLLEIIRRSGAKRVFIDGLAGFQRSTASPERLDLFLTAFITTLRTFDITTFLSVELPDIFSPNVELPAAISGTGTHVENVLLLRYVELRSQLYRLISIMKMRESGYDPSIREFRISSNGVEVASTFSSAEAILTGIARLRNEVQSINDDTLSNNETTSGPLKRHA